MGGVTETGRESEWEGGSDRETGIRRERERQGGGQKSGREKGGERQRASE